MDVVDAFPGLSNFLSAVHRRLVVLRAVERAGIYLVIGSGLVLPLVAVLVWRGEPAGWLAAGVLTSAFVVGLGWGLVRRPSVLDAAAEADRQLGLADLLATACYVRGGRTANEAAWGQAVLAMADARCRTLPASALVLHRLGGRAWAGIGLAAALVLTLSVMSITPAESRAAERVAQAAPVISPARATEDPLGTASLPPGSRERAEAANEPQDQAPNIPVPLSSRPSKESSIAGSPTLPPAAATPGGAGRGMARTTGEGRRADDPLATSTTAAVKNNPQAAPAAGVGRSTAGAAATGDTTPSGAAAGAADGHRAAPPWSSDRWPDARAAAGAAVDSGQVPPAYMDLVRDYFNRAP